MNSKKSLHIYAIIVGLFFIISGFGKVVDTTGFGQLIYQYGLGSFSVLAPFIVVAEIALGLFLILLINPKQVSFYSLVLMILFTVSFAYGYFTNGISDCGCFGTLKQLQTSPLVSFIRNGILILMLALVWIFYPKQPYQFSKLKCTIILAVLGVSIFISGLTFTKKAFTQYAKTFKKENERKARPITDTKLPKFVKTSADSTYAIIAFSYSCPHCLNSIENISKYIDAGIVDHVIGLGSGKEEDKKEFYTYFKPDFPIKELSQAEMITLTRKVPTTFFVKNDTIKFIIQSVAPSPLTLKKQRYLEKYF